MDYRSSRRFGSSNFGWTGGIVSSTVSTTTRRWIIVYPLSSTEERTIWCSRVVGFIMSPLIVAFLALVALAKPGSYLWLATRTVAM
ncbi:MAG: hypothetical protein ACXAC5_03515 [Promethearchaeota archaeon]